MCWNVQGSFSLILYDCVMTWNIDFLTKSVEMISKSIVIHKLKQKSGKAIQFYDVLYDFCCFFQNHEASCLKCRSLGSLEVPHGIMQDARGNGMDKKISIKVQV